jgi:hypothetical protein
MIKNKTIVFKVISSAACKTKNLKMNAEKKDYY